MIYSRKVCARIPKDKPRDPEEGPCILGSKTPQAVYPLGKSMDHKMTDRASMPCIDNHLDILANGPFGTVSEINNGVQHGGGIMTVDSQTDR